MKKETIRNKLKAADDDMEDKFETDSEEDDDD